LSRWLSLPFIFGRRSKADPPVAPPDPPDDGRLRVLPMRLSDLDQVLEVEGSAFTTPWSRRAFTSELTQNGYAVYLVVKRGRRVIAYGGMWALLGEAHVTNIAVRPEERGRKIGETVLRSLLLRAEARGCLRVTLEVRRTNHVAQNLYRKYAFEEKAVRRGYYTDNGEDAFVMVRDGLSAPPLPPAPRLEDLAQP
jgi:ribosomal-protein-alanine N-acetyltransferase